ncbi:D-inositol-3-phosphate glycosyltransferase [subsurface metagenome]
MKVLLPTEYYPPFVMGGGEISTKLLAEGLAREGVEVHVLTPNYESFSNTVSEGKGVHLYRFRSIRRFLHRGRKAFQVSYRRRKPLFYWLLSKYIRFSAWEFSKRVSKLHERENFDLIHAQNLESALGLNLAEVRCPRIAHIRDFGLFCMNRGKLIGESLCDSCSINNILACLGAGRFLARSIWNELSWRRAHSGFDHYIAISNFVARELKKENIPDEKISVIYNPIGDEEISHLSKQEAKRSLGLDYEKVALFVGGLTEAKGAHLLPKLARKMPNVNFVVVGDGPLRGLFENGPNNICCRGHVPHEEVKHYFRAADIVLVPSLWHEPFGRVVVEGQINSTPVVASRIGGIPELIKDGKTGLLVEPGELNDLMNAITKVMSSEGLRKRVGDKGHKAARKKYVTRTIVKRMLNAYGKLM